MASFNDTNKIGLSLSSKKINKRTCRLQFKEVSSPQDDEDLVVKKYKTYTKAQKLSIITDLKKNFGSRFTKTNGSSDGLINYLESLDKLEYNDIIEKLIASHGPSSLKDKGDPEKWHKCLKQWRRQLKMWIKNIDKPENRGSARVVSHGNANEFKQKLIEIISNMTIRSFELLREKVILALQEMHKRQNSGQPFNRNTFSKHFWYDYKKLHPDVDQLYMRLPRIRGTFEKSLRSEEVSVGFTGGDIEEDSDREFNIDFTTLTTEQNKPASSSSSSICENIVIDVPFVDPEIQENWKAFSSIEQNLMENTTLLTEDIVSVEEKNPEVLDFCISDIPTTDEEEKVPKYDFYRENKMIVETEDNASQRRLFRRFYKNGI